MLIMGWSGEYHPGSLGVAQNVLGAPGSAFLRPQEHFSPAELAVFQIVTNP
jgi:hypothetical protein